MVDEGKKPTRDASRSNNTIVIDMNDPLYLHSNDTNGTPLIILKLTGTENYRVWDASLKHCIHSKNKFGFIDGTCVKPDPETSPFLAMQWERRNSVVLNWILNCVSVDLLVRQVFSRFAEGGVIEVVGCNGKWWSGMNLGRVGVTGLAGNQGVGTPMVPGFLWGRWMEVMGSSGSGGEGLGNRERGVVERWREIRRYKNSNSKRVTWVISLGILHSWSLVLVGTFSESPYWVNSFGK
nr:ribonuclease H-like domain-containing protein [Tanacetum cinerariifolium]